MATETVEKKPRRKTRRNYAKELERVTMYLETVIRIMGADDSNSEGLKGALKAYRDVLNYMEQK